MIACVATVAIFDVSMGLYLLFSPTPELAHGASAIWARAPELVPREGAEGARLLGSFFSRLGAFSLHAGVSTLVWLWLARGEGRMTTALLVTYLVTGLGFFASDTRFFEGTTYYLVKQALGAIWMLALGVHLVDRRIARISGPRPARS